MNRVKTYHHQTLEISKSIYSAPTTNGLAYPSTPLQVVKVANTRSQKQALALGFYKQLIDAQLSGRSVLPYGLGLALEHYHELLALLADKSLLAQDKAWHKDNEAAIALRKKSDLLAELINLRDSEKADLNQLLSKHANKKIHCTTLAAQIIACASLSSAHLWKSLGFSTRDDLSLWIKINFPSLHAANNQGMRWKRFFYLQLCQQGGDYVCRAPSCDQCSSYAECFLPS